MKKVLTILILFTGFFAKAQQNYWQQYLSFSIDVQLDVAAKTLTGNETLIYKNYSPDTLTYIWFHLYPNAYRNDSTALYQQIKK